MKDVLFCSREQIMELTSIREHEVKIGEQISFIDSYETLKNSPAKYILLGIAEDVGIRANHGRAGATSTWKAALQIFVNLQHSQYTRSENIAILGEVDVREETLLSNQLLPTEKNYLSAMGQLVERIDLKLSQIIAQITALGKIPILIGGGHNNAYGMIKGTATGLGHAVNSINFDAHTDFRPLEHRHSGNGFSYAYDRGHLDKYFIFGLQRNYTSQAIWNTMHEKADRIQYVLYEDIILKRKWSFEEALENATKFISDKAYGIEIDLDSIAHTGSSAMTPSAFDLAKARRFLYHLSHQDNCAYIHLCEGAIQHEAYPNQVAKTLAYLISDCVA